MYMIGIDQSTQGTKALLFDENGRLLERADRPHEQKISSEGYVSHDPEEIYRNVCLTVKEVLEKYQGRKFTADVRINPEENSKEVGKKLEQNSKEVAKLEQNGNGAAAKQQSTVMGKYQIAGIGISNQRETTVAWDRRTGKPVMDAIVWQCSRAEGICKDFTEEEKQLILEKTGMPLSPYFPAAKMAWILQNSSKARALAAEGRLCMGTIDSWLVFCMTKGKEFRIDDSNASRTQLLNLHTLKWDQELCRLFGIPMESLPAVTDSDGLYGLTDLDGVLEESVPIHGVLGDSHGALFGHGCVEKGMVKATYGTGSSLMMNIGTDFAASTHGIVTSIAWSREGKVDYCLEGNLNYTGAVITWLKEDLQLIRSAQETEALARAARKEDTTCLVPAFSGLGAPYWNSEAKACICGMTRTTGRNEIVRAALDCIACQITDILTAMEQDSGMKLEKLCVDGGPTRNGYLMQLQSDLSKVQVRVPKAEELSGIGAAYLAGIALGIYQEDTLFLGMEYQTFVPKMEEAEREKKLSAWKEAVNSVIKCR